MGKINAAITGVGGYVPEYVLTNDELSRMVDTNDEWIMTRIGVKERRILNEEGLGTSYMARKAVKQLLERTNTDPAEIDCIIVSTTTPDYHFPSTASIVLGRLGLVNAFAFDFSAACCGFLYSMDIGASMIIPTAQHAPYSVTAPELCFSSPQKKITALWILTSARTARGFLSFA